jgi:ATPase subunit of ABC transporter with duplicated ATPase domains
MSKNETILSFDEVSFEYNPNKPILTEVSFSLRSGFKATIMGQNGAGKSTLFKLITGEIKPEEGDIIKKTNLTIATARQVIPREDLELTLRDYFEKAILDGLKGQKNAPTKIYDIDPRIDEVLEVVNLKHHEKMHDKLLKSFSGGQQARILLAGALIQNPDLLLLDEPTNNLDKAGIEHLTNFLKDYKKTVVVISHDAEFLNAFTDGVLYLDIFTKKVEQYVGNYFDVLKEITARVEKENRLNAQLAKQIQAKKDKANEFAHKGGRLRLVAKRMRELAEDLEDEMVDIRKEDKAIKSFTIPCQEDIYGEIINITSFTMMHHGTGQVVKREKEVVLKKSQHLLLKGPNGIGKSTLLETLAKGLSDGAKISPGIRVGYYRQDFSTLDFNKTVYQELVEAMVLGGQTENEHTMRSVAASFLLTGEIVRTQIGRLSEGQKGLVAFARLVLLRPGLLIMDEPTNHINFRHLPIIAKAISDFSGALILVSHDSEFVSKIKIDEVLDLEK